MIKNSRGEGYISTCVMVVAVCMILSAFVAFAGAVNVVRLVERNSKTVMESFITENSIDIYNSIKQGNNVVDEVSAAEYRSELADFCTFVSRGALYYHYGEDGRTEYYITRPEVTIDEGKLKLEISYTLYVPIYFNNIRTGTARIPMTVKVNLDERF